MATIRRTNSRRQTVWIPRSPLSDVTNDTSNQLSVTFSPTSSKVPTSLSTNCGELTHSPTTNSERPEKNGFAGIPPPDPDVEATRTVSAIPALDPHTNAMPALPGSSSECSQPAARPVATPVLTPEGTPAAEPDEIPEAVRGWTLDLILHGCDDDGGEDCDSLTTMTPLHVAGDNSDDGVVGVDSAENADGEGDDSDAGETALRSEVSKLLLASPHPSDDPETPEMIGGKRKSRLSGRRRQTATPEGPPIAETPHTLATIATATATATANANANMTETETVTASAEHATATATPPAETSRAAPHTATSAGPSFVRANGAEGANAKGGSASRPIARAATSVRKASFLPRPTAGEAAATAAATVAAAGAGAGAGSAGKRPRATWQVNSEVSGAVLEREPSLAAPNYWRDHALALLVVQAVQTVRAVQAVHATCNLRPPRPLSPMARGTLPPVGAADSLPHGGGGMRTDSTSPNSAVSGRASQQGSTDPAADLAADSAGAVIWSTQVNDGVAGSKKRGGWVETFVRVDEGEEGEVGEEGEEGEVREEGEEREVTEEGDDSKTVWRAEAEGEGMRGCLVVASPPQSIKATAGVGGGRRRGTWAERMASRRDQQEGVLKMAMQAGQARGDRVASRHQHHVLRGGMQCSPPQLVRVTGGVAGGKRILSRKNSSSTLSVQGSEGVRGARLRGTWAERMVGLREQQGGVLQRAMLQGGQARGERVVSRSEQQQKGMLGIMAGRAGKCRSVSGRLLKCLKEMQEEERCETSQDAWGSRGCSKEGNGGGRAG
ncbi:unnamed protein product [Closterium sp. NIES-53]